MTRTLSHAEARAFYDRFGSRQDRQAFYEDRAVADLLTHGDFGAARAVLEFGCGTGRLAARLLAGPLPAGATYLGLDLSRTMVALARERLAPWGGRADVRLSDGSMALAVGDGAIDRFLATYVLDLLSEADIRALMAEARRALAPGGLVCLASLTYGRSPGARLVTRLWRGIFALNPRLVGGCRPVRLRHHLPERHWDVRRHAVIETWAIASEVVVAARA